MWQSTLIISKMQLIFVSLFYLILIICVVACFFNTYLDDFSEVFILLCIYEWWRAICYFTTHTGELTFFDKIDQLYWQQQRWHIVGKPLLFRFVVILNLQSRKNEQKTALFLMSDHFCDKDWRTLHYWLRNNLTI